MTSSFEKHGIDHLSPSSLNKWRATPRLWCLKYLMKAEEDKSQSMARGTAVEWGFELFLRGASFDKALEEAQKKFLKLTDGEV
jgi:hypothetical protein